MFRKVVAFGSALASSILAADIGNVATCYSPFHLPEYPLHNNFEPNQVALQKAIDNDFKIMSQHFTHVRTFYSQYYGTNPTKSAATAGVKLYLGVFMTWESWQSAEVNAAVEAVKKYPGTVEAILVGNENLQQFGAKRILELVDQIKEGLGDLAGTVKFGTVQRISEYVDKNFDIQTRQLEKELDILGVNIYPFFSPYDPKHPAAELQRQWDEMKAKFPLSKMRLTETGYPTEGEPSFTGAKPSLNESIAYYNAVKDWKPTGADSYPKFWFMAFDRHPDDRTMKMKHELHFGFYTYDLKPKVPVGGYPVKLSDPEPIKPITVSPSQNAVIGDCISSNITLQADSGSYVARCTNCSPGADADSVAVNIADPGGKPDAQWRVHRLDNGKFAFEATSGLYLGRCNNCHPKGLKPDSAFVHVKSPEGNPWAQWDVEFLANGKVALRADSGKYMARCNKCVHGGAVDMVFVHATSSDYPWAQFDLKCM
ncbi:TPA: hypothetical protein N0F65_012452 [Lagenidium giganteum]|uniref:glucan endo-1,3-beta-D-glucosidase n=1 Tax=Lagenidium giganteum TaxID=4803 RepID=A0AAV2YEX2_9STRA|nr:TPA: hypothetical protein N0F65_012452 [Lagenidium giganteum]